MNLRHSPPVAFLRKKAGGRVKSLIYSILNVFWGNLPSDRAVVLMYHSIGDNPVFFTVKPKDFQRQMDKLFQEKYNVVSLSRLAEYIGRKSIPAKTVVLTFDDGYEDNYFSALPVLKKYNFSAAVFLATGFAGEKIPNSADFPLKSLNWRQIREMHDSGLIDFQPHTVSHPKLSRVSFEEAEKEILQSKKCLEENLKKTCRFFAYPKGDYSRQTEDLLKKHGFSLALTIKEGLISPEDNPFVLNRNSIDSSVNLTQFRGKISRSVEVFREIFKPLQPSCKNE